MFYGNEINLAVYRYKIVSRGHFKAKSMSVSRVSRLRRFGALDQLCYEVVRCDDVIDQWGDQYAGKALRKISRLYFGLSIQPPTHRAPAI